MARRVRHEIGATPLWVAPLEYVVLRKLEWHREGGSARHLEDVRAMLRVSGDRLNRTDLQEWISHMGLEDVWRQVSDV